MSWFAKRRETKVRRLEAVVEAYEKRLEHKNLLIKETEAMRQDAQAQINHMETLMENLEECNEALASENRRLAGERDWLQDVVRQMYVEMCQADKRAEEAETLDRDNQRIWQENVALREALCRLDPERARWICGRR